MQKFQRKGSDWCIQWQRMDAAKIANTIAEFLDKQADDFRQNSAKGGAGRLAPRPNKRIFYCMTNHNLYVVERGTGYAGDENFSGEGQRSFRLESGDWLVIDESCDVRVMNDWDFRRLYGAGDEASDE